MFDLAQNTETAKLPELHSGFWINHQDSIYPATVSHWTLPMVYRNVLDATLTNITVVAAFDETISTCRLIVAATVNETEKDGTLHKVAVTYPVVADFDRVVADTARNRYRYQPAEAFCYKEEINRGHAVLDDISAGYCFGQRCPDYRHRLVFEGYLNEDGALVFSLIREPIVQDRYTESAPSIRITGTLYPSPTTHWEPSSVCYYQDDYGIGLLPIECHFDFTASD